MLLQLACCNTKNEKRSLSPKTALFLNIAFKACYTPSLLEKKGGGKTVYSKLSAFKLVILLLNAPACCNGNTSVLM